MVMLTLDLRRHIFALKAERHAIRNRLTHHQTPSRDEQMPKTTQTILTPGTLAKEIIRTYWPKHPPFLFGAIRLLRG